MRKIIVEHKIKKVICQELNTSYTTVKSALFGMTETDLALRIRARALELGGMEVLPKNIEV